jgi:hypothetical protein
MDGGAGSDEVLGGDALEQESEATARRSGRRGDMLERALAQRARS